jgi:hypothetical protein
MGQAQLIIQHILPYKFVATVTTQTTYLLCLANVSVLLSNLEKL